MDLPDIVLKALLRECVEVTPGLPATDGRVNRLRANRSTAIIRGDARQFPALMILATVVSISRVAGQSTPDATRLLALRGR